MLIRLDSSSVCMTETTLRHMFALDRCIDVMFERLDQLDTVDVKYKVQHRIRRHYTRHLQWTSTRRLRAWL